MKHVKYFFAAGLFAAVLLAGCGVNKTEDKSDKNYSEQATVPTAEPSEEIDPFANSTNRYMELEFADEEAEEGEIMQMDLKNALDQQRIKIKNLSSLCWVTDEWLYYYGADITYTQIYRIPIQKVDGKDKLLLDKNEMIYETEDELGEIYVSEEYILFTLALSNNLYKLNLSDKKVQVLQKRVGEAPDLVYDSDTGNLIRKNELLFLETEESFYTVNPDKGELHKIYSDKDVGEAYRVFSEGVFYFIDNNQVYSFTGEEEQAKCLIKEETIQKKMEEIAPWWKKGTFETAEIHGDGEKVYVELQVDWLVKERAEDGPAKGSMVDRRYYRSILFSSDGQEGSALQYEEAFSEYWNKTVKHRKSDGQGAEYYSEESGLIYGIWDHSVIFCDKAESDVLMGYDLETGEEKELTEAEWTECIYRFKLDMPLEVLRDFLS